MKRFLLFCFIALIFTSCPYHSGEIDNEEEVQFDDVLDTELEPAKTIFSSGETITLHFSGSISSTQNDDAILSFWIRKSETGDWLDLSIDNESLADVSVEYSKLRKKCFVTILKDNLQNIDKSISFSIEQPGNYELYFSLICEGSKENRYHDSIFDKKISLSVE